ncbi:hypothetical protein HDU93_007016 [Gonapodya sp. JEL0774]|nr:hypothetical protein HDU93_007016 [Gonapodya sp. JEL0774]
MSPAPPTPPMQDPQAGDATPSSTPHQRQPVYPPPAESIMDNLRVQPPPLFCFYNLLYDEKVFRIPVELPLAKIETVHKQLRDGLGLDENTTITGVKIGSGIYFPFFHLPRLPPWDIYEPILVPSFPPTLLRSPPILPPPPPSQYGPLGIPLAHLSPTSAPPDHYNAASRTLADELATHGYALIRTDPHYADVFQTARRAALAYFGATPEDEKKKLRREFGDTGKFVGYARSGAREWFQVRTTPAAGVDVAGGDDVAADAGNARTQTDSGVKGASADEDRHSNPESVVEAFATESRAESPPFIPPTGSRDPFSLIPWPDFQLHDTNSSSPATSTQPQTFRTALTALHDALNHLSHTLLTSVLHGLSVPPDDAAIVLAMVDPIDKPTPKKTEDGVTLPGPSVLRVYKYYRPPGSRVPGLSGAATGLHADMGFITVSPVSNLAGLVGLRPSCDGWVDVEKDLVCGKEGVEDEVVLVMVGDTLSEVVRRLRIRDHVRRSERGETKGGDGIRPLPPGLHYVDEREMGKARISMPFFLRPHPSALLPSLPPLPPITFTSTPLPPSSTATPASDAPDPPIAAPPPLKTAHPDEIKTVAEFIERDVFVKRPWGPGTSRSGGKGDY